MRCGVMKPNLPSVRFRTCGSGERRRFIPSSSRSPVKNDLRFALRMISAHRWFSCAVIITLALGIGINTTVFTLVNAVLFKPIPLPNGSRLVTINGQDLTRADNRRGLSYPDYVE